MIISSHRGECSSWSLWRSGDYPLDSLPPGYRFKPSDKEICDHLHHKIIHGVSLLQNIKHVNLYDFHPQTLTKKHPPLADKEWYFFTTRNRKYTKGTRPDRTAEKGYWRATTKQNDVKYEGKVIGKKQSLDFVVGDHQNGRKSIWKMHEFTVEKSHLPTTTTITTTPPTTNHTHTDDDSTVEGWILCRVYRRRGKVKENPKQRRQLLHHHHTSEALVVEAAEEVNKQIDQTITIDDTNVVINPGAGAGDEQFYNGNDVSASMEMGEDLMWTQTLTNPPHPCLDQTVSYNTSVYPSQYYSGGYFSSLLLMGGEECHDPYLDQTLVYPPQQFYYGSNQDVCTLINPQSSPPSLDQVTVDCPTAAAEQFYNGCRNVSGASMRMEQDLRTQINPQDCPVDQTVDECRNVNLSAAAGQFYNGQDSRAVGQMPSTIS